MVILPSLLCTRFIRNTSPVIKDCYLSIRHVPQKVWSRTLDLSANPSFSLYRHRTLSGVISLQHLFRYFSTKPLQRVASVPNMSSLINTASTTTTTTTTAGDVKTISLQKELQLQPQQKQREIFRKDYKPSDYRINHITLDFQLGYTDTHVITDLYMYRSGDASDSLSDLVLDGEDLTLVDIQLTVDNVTLPKRGAFTRSSEYSRTLKADKNEYKLLWGQDDGKLWINGSLLPKAANSLFKLTTHVILHPETNLQLSGLYKSGSLLCTQCEAEGFRRITYSLDRPDILSTFTVRLEGEHDEFPVLLSNGNEISSGQIVDKKYINGNGINDQSRIKMARQGTRHFAVYEDPFLKPCYLFAIVAGNLAKKEDIFIRENNKPVTLCLWCEPEEKDKLDWALSSLKTAMEWDAKTYQLHYDLDSFNIVAVQNFNFGAMENKSLNIFNSALLLASQDTSTDLNFITIMCVVGHEYFHNWTGNRVTCRDWFQLTLKEGLTVYREQEFHASWWSRAVARIEDIKLLRSTQFPEDSGPLSHPVRPESYIAMDNFYTATVYEKGAEIVRMYETILGTEGFKKGLKLYLTRHDGQAVTCDDFLKAMEDANNRDLTNMQPWYSRSGTPIVQIDCVEYNSLKKQFHFRLKQLNTQEPPLLIPIKFGLIGRVSKKDVIESTVIELNTNDYMTHVVNDVNEDCVLSILRGFSAPIRLNYSISNDDLAFLMANDTDSFNQWESREKLSLRVILDKSQQVTYDTNGLPVLTDTSLPITFLDAVSAVLDSTRHDLFLQALLLELPDTSTLIEESSTPCDPLAIYFTREFVKHKLGQLMNKQFLNIYTTLTTEMKEQSYQVTCKDVGKRRLRNLCLNYLSAISPVEKMSSSSISNVAKFAFNHFQSAENMTDKMAALQCLSHIPSEERTLALDQFRRDAPKDDSVLNKWFSVQAGSNVPNVLDDIQALKQHPDFKPTNANYIRALIGSFTANIPHFHHFDGAGYKFLADEILSIDSFNNQVAARLANRFSNWKRFSTKRQELMQAQLQRILASPNLSKDCYEICNKALTHVS